MNEWMDIGQLSLYLNIKKKTLYSMVRNGGIPSYKLNRMVRFKRTEIDEWMATHKNTTACRKIVKKKIPVTDKEKEQMIMKMANEAVASFHSRSREKQQGKGAKKEKGNGTL